MAESLETLMERYVDGDAAAFDTLYALIRPPMLASLRRWLKDTPRVEDGFQTALLKLHASRDRYQRGAPVLPWVLTITRNVALDRLRAKSERAKPLDPEAAAAIPDEDERLARWGEDDEAEVIAAVRAAVAELPESTRSVIELHKLEGRSMSEVAELLGIKEGAARVRAHRGYKALARLLLGFRSERT